MKSQPKQDKPDKPGSGMFSRLAWGIGLGFVLFHAIAVMYGSHDNLVAQAGSFTISVIDRARLINKLTDGQPELLKQLSSTDFRMSITSLAPMAPTADESWRHEATVRGVVDTYLNEQGLDPAEVKFWFQMRRGEPELILALPHVSEKAHVGEEVHVRDEAHVGDETQVGATPSAGAEWLMVYARPEPTRFQRGFAGLARTTVIGVLILLAVLWATRRVTRFLPKLAAAAERVGSSIDLEPLPIEGPKELRLASAAFNRMQDKIVLHETERRTMLGALSHDIRTLVTRLGLRVERMSDTTTRQKAEQELAAITQIVDEALAYSKDEMSTEPMVALDLVSLLQSLVDDAADGLRQRVGSQLPSSVSAEGVFSEARNVKVLGQSVGLTRAFANLLDNALLYGGHARVEVLVEGGNAVVVVADHGPGIPVHEQARVLAPYVRLDSSRSRDTGGTGLGLAIVNNVVARHGGRLEFGTTTDPAGFQVRVSLPLA